MTTLKYIRGRLRIFGNGGNGDASLTLDVAISKSLVSVVDLARSISIPANDPSAFKVKTMYASPSLS